jgi:hypothetical protein
LEEEQAVVFNHSTAQLLFTVKRACHYIQTAVACKTPRMKSPDEDFWGKEKIVLKYLNRQKCLRLTISVKKLGILKWYEDGSHDVPIGTVREMEE